MNAASTVGSLVAERPGRARLLEVLGLDYCCGGRKALADACAELGLDTAAVLRDLAADDAAVTAEPDVRPADMGLAELADHIEATHHAFMRSELPRVSVLAERVVRAHGDTHPEMLQVRSVFEALRQELEAHLQKEEIVLFPICRDLEAATALPAFHCGSVANPIRVMEMEHDSAGGALAMFRELTGNYTTPEDGCSTYTALLDALQGLEADLHQHIHKENNILFPRAIALEGKLAG